MKIITFAICAFATALICQAEPESKPDPAPGTQKPTILGVGVGSKMTEFLDMLIIKKPKAYNKDYGNTPANMKAAHDELLKKLESPEFEENYIVNKGSYGWAGFDAAFEPGTVQLLGLDATATSSQATYDPISDDFLMFNMKITLAIPEGSSFAKTLPAILGLLAPQFGHPDLTGEHGASWKKLGPLETRLNISGNDDQIEIFLSDKGSLQELALANRKTRLAEYNDAKKVPQVQGKLE